MQLLKEPAFYVNVN